MGPQTQAAWYQWHMACSRNTWLGLLAFAVAGCGRPLSAKLDVPFWPVAVGSYAEVKVYDGSYIWTPFHATITSTSVSDPTVARILSQTETPAELWNNAAASDTIYLQGLKAGRTNLSAHADFSDGSHRSATATVAVKSIDALAPVTDCDGPVDLPLRTFPGDALMFEAALTNAGERLAGYIPGAIVGNGIVCGPGEHVLLADLSTVTICAWTAPATGGSTTLSSPLLPAFSAHLDIYAPADVTGIGIEPGFGEEFGVVGNSPGIKTYVKLAQGRPCKSMPVQAMTKSPSICTGPNGETEWSSDSNHFVDYLGTAVGDCVLALGAAGAASFPTTIHIPIRPPSQ
jgi:hypothetical protein